MERLVLFSVAGQFPQNREARQREAVVNCLSLLLLEGRCFSVVFDFDEFIMLHLCFLFVFIYTVCSIKNGHIFREKFCLRKTKNMSILNGTHCTST
jgi:hypothetical protein